MRYEIIYDDNYAGRSKMFVNAQDAQGAYRKFKRTIYGSSTVLYISKAPQKTILQKLIMILAIALLIIMSFSALLNYMIPPSPVDYDRYVVQKGDTLWDISKLSDGWNNIDANQIIHDIKVKSNCSSEIYPGDIIYIPQYEFQSMYN